MSQAVLELREQHPRWGKDKLAVLLRREDWQVSTSMVGRILTSLKIRGVLREPPANGISARKRHRPRPYAVRKPKEYQAREPGDIVQVDTLDVRPLPGVVLKHFTARDVVSRWDVLEVHTRATATTAKAFLDTLQDRLPFPLNPNPPMDRDGRGEDSGRGEGVTGAMIRARIWVDGRLAGGLQRFWGHRWRPTVAVAREMAG